MAASTCSCRSSRPAIQWADPISADLSLITCTCCGERVARYFFVDVDRLGVLSEVVKAGESPITVALERTFSSVFPASNVSTIRQDEVGVPTVCDEPNARCA